MLVSIQQSFVHRLSAQLLKTLSVLHLLHSTSLLLQASVSMTHTYQCEFVARDGKVSVWDPEHLTQSPDSINRERKSGEKPMASGQRGDQVVQWTSNCKELVHHVCSNEQPRKVMLLSFYCTKAKHRQLSDCSQSSLFTQFEESLIPTSSQ